MKLIILTKKKLIALGCCVLALIVVGIGGAKGISVATAAQNRKLPIYCVETEKKQVCLTFDAAWGNEDTQILIDILKKYNAKATFFLVGQWVDKYPESVKALSDAGHSIQNHSNTHPNLPKLSSDGIQKEISQCNDKIKAITGKCPTLLRAPYGDYNNTLIETMDSMNMYTIQWDVDSLDWKDLDADTITKKVLSKVKCGSIVLFHNAALHTPEALPAILEQLQKDGYEFITVEQLIYKDNYTIDHAGKQIQNSAAVTTPNSSTAAQTTATNA